MTTEIEKTFFDTFGIEQREHKECECDYLNCPNPEIEECEECYYYKTYKFDYPTISDRILLKLICIANSQNIGFEGDNIEDIKKDLLDNFIFFKRDVYDQIHNLFKEVG